MDDLAVFRVDGRAAMVTGASGGIGARASAALAAGGADLVLVGRSAERMQATREAVEQAGRRALVVEADMGSAPEVQGAVDQAVERFGRIDILVNTVGGGAGGALYPAQEYPKPEWDRIVDLNLTTTLLPTQAVARAMIETGSGGAILNLSSVRGQLGIDAGYSAYVAAKGALDAVTRQWATEWAKHGIRVNSIAPTFVRTEQTASMLADQAFYDRLVARIPLRRIASTDDLVGAVLFFCSQASAFVTGQLLTLDGGLTATQ